MSQSSSSFAITRPDCTSAGWFLAGRRNMTPITEPHPVGYLWDHHTQRWVPPIHEDVSRVDDKPDPSHITEPRLLLDAGGFRVGVEATGTILFVTGGTGRISRENMRRLINAFITWDKETP